MKLQTGPIRKKIGEFELLRSPHRCEFFENSSEGGDGGGAGSGSCCMHFAYLQKTRKACLNFTFENQSEILRTVVSLNDRVLVKKNVLKGSGGGSSNSLKPFCVRVPKLNAFRLCLKLYNFYLIDRNVHVCIDMIAHFQDVTFVRISFDCIRFGTNGFAILSPESGGGLPVHVSSGSNYTFAGEDYDYDDNA